MGAAHTMTSNDTSATRSWRKGCGYVVASIFFFAGVTGFLALRPVREVKRIEQTLNDRFGEATTWSPAADGTVPSDRTEAFIAVRERLQGLCTRFEDSRDRVEELGRLEEGDEISWDRLLDGFKAALSFGPSFLHLMRSRNEALLEEGMGLGEYSYIYSVAYGDRLSSLASDPGLKDLFQSRTRRELTEILRNQLEALASQSSEGRDQDLSTLVQKEIVALENGAHAFPWQEGLPPLIEASLEPYRDRLDNLFCEAAVNSELRQKNKNPGGFGD
jgi:hypothetical protein